MIVPTERIGRVKNVDRGHSIGVNKPKNTMEMVKLMKVVVMGREGARERSISGDVGRQVGSEGRGKQKDGAGDGRGVVGGRHRFDPSVFDPLTVFVSNASLFGLFTAFCYQSRRRHDVYRECRLCPQRTRFRRFVFVQLIVTTCSFCQ